MNKLKGFLTVGLFAFALTISSFASAEDLNPPQQVIQETSDLLHDILQKDKSKLDDLDYVFQLVNEVLEPRVDLNKISRLVLGKHWRKASEEQKTSFQKEFKGLLVNTYATAFKEFDEWTIHFIPMTFDPTDTRLMVKTEIIQPSRPPVAVNYRMALNKAGEWKAYDVIIEGISMVTNYKASFSKTIKSAGGLDQVIQQLAEKNKLSETDSQLVREETSNKS
ncbi:MAG: phospholipid transport system substrate-binding protein [Cycloclasticus pugetii]|jgi:phospholipid transport system substrate-binding protein|uniref:ABC-type transport system involved in resistance to organic solvents, auxiliary component n=2 Tax=Cycloclasticus TaxID=34067 RepID=S5TUH2_9GAMM|nr:MULTISPECIES: ABC transporter substrate-binding protein [Cycloclasticus]AGS38670.1 ABC-type transport system involved in resistance to organic solvents, auxiliary component [Cycloclasticus zancles 78-ME]ATI02337.1 ABC transporter substrate-binding protein [Cycloclasticus sp. PY97N]EPD12426.1 organic solvent resistance ABC transporter auxiliary protein [Cycloclasticus pugetii]MBV1898169.1 ABC transporter substrate-binding protein [Cycloclasticus sp.]MDF1829177.1 ABC transporter substrate-bin